MARSFMMMGYGLVAVTGLALLLTGTPTRRGIALAGQAPAAAPPSSSVSAAGVTLTSVSVELPVSERMFPESPGADTVNNNCLACHSVAMILNQPAMSRSVWQAEVNKMRTVFKAPVDEGDVPAIVDYLVRIKGKG
jgi:hypothetical protein